MSGEEDEKEYELKDLIVQTLEANGVLPKIKAQIRANVFMALDQNDKKNHSSILENASANKVLNTNDGRTAAALVRDFLEKANLEFTLAVFDPELNPTILLDRREKLVETFKTNEKSRDTPVLIEVVKQAANPSSSHMDSRNENISQRIIDAIKAKFDYIDVSRRGLIDEEKARDLFADLFPHFSRAVIDAYLNEELTNSDILRGVEYSKLLSIFKKWYLQCQRTHNMTEEEMTNLHKSKPKKVETYDVMDFNKTTRKDSMEEFKKPAASHHAMSSLGDLPPLNGASQNQNKKIHSLNKDLDKRYGDDDNYDEDFTSTTTPRTPKEERKTSKTRGSAGGLVSDEDVEDNLSYIEESSKIDEITVDKSISTIQNNDADYLEDVTI